MLSAECAPHVILSEAKDPMSCALLVDLKGILRFAQDDRPVVLV